MRIWVLVCSTKQPSRERKKGKRAEGEEEEKRRDSILYTNCGIQALLRRLCVHAYVLATYVNVYV